MSLPSELQQGHASTDSALYELESGEATEMKDREEEAMHSGAKYENKDVVDWDGPSDPANPRNWKARAKWTHVLLIGGFTLYS